MLFLCVSPPRVKTKYTDRACSSIKRVACFLSAFIFCLTLIFAAQITFAREESDLFFSIDRIALRPELVMRLTFKADGRAQKDIAEFAVNYANGMSEYSRGNFTLARDSFLKARKTWPEYFYADLAIALSYEAGGEYGEAARYYKSYLNKLKAYDRGHYGISAPLIKSFSRGHIENYDYAYGAVKNRLLQYGIKLGMVKSARSSGFFIQDIALFFAALIFIWIVFYIVIPFVRKKIRESNPPEGFWVCPSCGEYTPELSFECSACGKNRPGRKNKGITGKKNER